jgi:hypothetical protein
MTKTAEKKTYRRGGKAVVVNALPTDAAKRDVINFLKGGVVRINFKKADGTRRVMRATLDRSYLPTLEKGTRLGGPHKGVVTAWDVINNGWRSFNLDNVKSEYELLA